MKKRSPIKLAVIVSKEKMPRTYHGREAWALNELIQAGKSGLTTLTRPAPRWSHYILCLRRSGLTIETKTERHGGPYSGNHGRYILRTKVRRVA